MAALRFFFVDIPLHKGETLVLPKDLTRRLQKVLRIKPNTHLTLFNRTGTCITGTWDGEKITLETPIQSPPPVPVTLLIGLPKKDAMDRVLRQATELNITAIQPVICQYSVPDKLNKERAEKIIIEAAEQCERGTLPTLHTPISFQEALSAAPLYWAYERGDIHLRDITPPCSVLIGPEGGFSEPEVQQLSALKTAHSFTLGNSILRTDTAVAASLGAVISQL